MSDATSPVMPVEQTLSYHFAQRHGVLVTPSTGVCSHRAGTTSAALLEVQRLFGPTLDHQMIDDAAFERCLRDYYSDTAGDAAELAMAGTDLATLADTAAGLDDLLDARDDSPVVRLINALLLEAVRQQASDIHFETQEKRCIVRFRVDGVLRDIVEPARAFAPLLASRLKVMAELDIAEKRLPQDGRVSLRVGGHVIDVRVSTLPAQHGERLVLRLLDRDAVNLDLTRIGMSQRDRSVFERILTRPHGMVLVTGPTGSGKTTTLYSALHHLNDRARNIMTVEDPIEYEVGGIGQMQVNPRIDLDFAHGLRAILRQDPDIIMVGEIRDRETAQMAVRASMTGHFVLSTLHTNTAIASIARLIDMGVERYFLGPMIAGLIAQRLVRTLCPVCRTGGIASEVESAAMAGVLAIGETIYRPAGCSACGGEGYRGRTGLYEIVEIGDELQALIHGGAAHADLVAAARRAGPGLLDDGVVKVRAGLTSVAEVARVVEGGG